MKCKLFDTDVFLYQYRKKINLVQIIFKTNFDTEIDIISNQIKQSEKFKKALKDENLILEISNNNHYEVRLKKINDEIKIISKNKSSK